MKDITKDVLIGFMILILVTSIIFSGVFLTNNKEKMKYEFLKERGHNVIYSEDLIFGRCAYKKSYGVVDCNYEYNNAVWEDKFAIMEKQE